ncbi:hypothetical protein C4578_03165 [Candidatus Microgenomates bacterium]|nr:MAG: hypothetical protein C4578_03165 [Candidatus Microgenomates bacterium]
MKNKAFFFLPLILVVLTGLLFLSKLGDTPLKSWDEAWYAEISRNIVKDNQWFLLKWNGLPYFDHPPLGFWLTSLSFKLFGVSEMSARLPSALAGIGSVLLSYLIGKKLFNRAVGFAAGLSLSVFPWFWLRAREGNLDIVLTFNMLLALFFMLKAKESRLFLIGAGTAFALALLTKTVIGVGLIPVLFFLYFGCPKKEIKDIFFFFVPFFAIFLPWYVVNYLAYGLLFINRNIFVIGLRLPGMKSLGNLTSSKGFYLKNTLWELHMGVLLWYKPFLVSLLGSLLFIKQKSFQLLWLWFFVYFLVFATSPKAELWHLIILYPTLSLFIPAFIYKIGAKFDKRLAVFLMLAFCVWNSGRIVKGLFHDLVKSQSFSDEVSLSRKAGEYEGTIYLEDDYWPAAVFYSGKKVYSLPHSTDTTIKTSAQAFEKSDRPFLLLTKQWLLDRENISPKDYQVIKKEGERILVLVK